MHKLFIEIKNTLAALVADIGTAIQALVQRG